MKSRYDEIALEVLVFVAQIQAQVSVLRRQLELAGDVTNTLSFVECRQYESGLYLSTCIEAEMEAGRTLTLWMDIVPKADNWLLDARVSWNGQDIVLELPERSVTDFRDVQREAPLMLDELAEGGKRFLHSASQTDR